MNHCRRYLLALAVLITGCLAPLTPAVAQEQWGTWTLGPGSFGDLRWRSPVANEAALPATGNVLGDARVALAEASLWLWDGADWTAIGGSAGTVESVGLTVPSFLTVSGSPVTSSGTLAVTLANAPVSHVLVGPTAGFPAAPTFRALQAADVPYAAHASRHSDGSDDEVTVELLATACTIGQIVESDGAGGLVCADPGGGAVSIADVTSGTTTEDYVIGAGGTVKVASTGTIDASALDADGDGTRELSIASTRVNFDPDDDGVVESYIDANGDLSWGDAAVTRAGAGGVDIENGSGSYAYLRATGTQHFVAGTMKILIDPGVFFDSQIRMASDIEVAWTSSTTASAGSIDARIGRGAAGVVQLDGGTTSTGAILRLAPLATAPAACTAYSDIYVDTSGALCWCSATNTWSVVTGGGTCA